MDSFREPHWEAAESVHFRPENEDKRGESLLFQRVRTIISPYHFTGPVVHMRTDSLKDLVHGTADPAFAVDSSGHIVSWNSGAEALFGLTTEAAVGKLCCAVIRGVDECGGVCSPNCVVQQATQKGKSITNFDLQIETVEGQRWCNISVLIPSQQTLNNGCAIHIVRQIDLQKRLELMMRDFLVRGTDLSAEAANALLTSRSPARTTTLSAREITVLKMLAKGGSTLSIASALHISRTTVHNHIQHILQKLTAHSRLEAIRRAERAGLI